MRVTKRHGGFGLVEALVALVVLSVGLMGVAALHARGLAAIRSALHRATAIDLAADLADRMRANAPGAAAYASGAGADRGCGAGRGCSPAQMAEHDLLAWRREVEARLPDGHAVIEVADEPPPAVTIRLGWREPEVGAVGHAAVVRVPEG